MAIKHRTPGWLVLAAASILSITIVGAAVGQQARVRPSAPPAARNAPRVGQHQHFDGRFSNNHYYYDRGYTTRRPPPGSIGELHDRHGGRYWYHGGDWYRWRNDSWVVWGAPVGVFVPWLPPYFSTVWRQGVPYYYANDTYYMWDADQNKYQVVAPPAGIETTATTQAPPTDRLFVYPKKAQSTAQQSQDKYDCHRWAMEQSGFDPTKPGGGVPAAQVAQKRSDYLRADASCLEGRGYTVR